MKTIGTDASLQVCKKEGYLMMRYDPKKDFDRSEWYNVFSYFPEYVEKDLPYYSRKGEKCIDTCVSWNDLLKTYNERKDEIDRYADDMPEVMGKENPNYYDLLNAASIINSYYGLP